MTPEELFKEKKHLVIAAINQKFGNVLSAKHIAELNNMDLEDLIQVGSIRLWQLCLNYNPEKEKSFNQYAVIGIQGVILNELFEKGKTIRFPKNIKKEIRDEFEFQSIDLYTSEYVINEFFAVSPINMEEDVIESIEFEEIVSGLCEKEKFVLMQKSYGYTDKEIGTKLNVDTSTVSRIKNKAVIKLNPDRKSLGFATRKKKNHLLQQVI
ncbi:sigma-70 family RNA polymerase sigma factor [Bacillus cereus]|uniref:sigma-70 family RNA polymerase sigma factor n=1 Tax=Bacillus cereus TaxID=1396 RepID=UPI00156B2842|nr:sigma-70 family RNA polymerase sigma factor [Bacillus cereus]UDV85410.1 sigma-70 family RNA polymerase sigma factor [Bacillus cereus]UDV90955.1 sigma-70 family RNA polymerase sigma factor [Bacillus cereus]